MIYCMVINILADCNLDGAGCRTGFDTEDVDTGGEGGGIKCCVVSYGFGRGCKCAADGVEICQNSLCGRCIDVKNVFGCLVNEDFVLCLYSVDSGTDIEHFFDASESVYFTYTEAMGIGTCEFVLNGCLFDDVFDFVDSQGGVGLKPEGKNTAPAPKNAVGASMGPLEASRPIWLSMARLIKTVTLSPVNCACFCILSRRSGVILTSTRTNLSM